MAGLYHQTQAYTIDVASADFSATANRFRVLAFGASGWALPTAGGAVHGVLQNLPASGEAVSVVTPHAGGITKVRAGGPITKGANVAAAADGDVVAAVATDIIIGVALEAAVDGQHIEILFAGSYGTQA